MCEMIVKQLYIFLCEGTIGQFCTNFRDFRWYIGPAKDEPWKTLCNMMTFYSHFHKKRSKIAKYNPKCESGITNLSDKIMNM